MDAMISAHAGPSARSQRAVPVVTAAAPPPAPAAPRDDSYLMTPYWKSSMGRKQAEDLLALQPAGTGLIRAASQANAVAVSYVLADGTVAHTAVRVSDGSFDVTDVDRRVTAFKSMNDVLRSLGVTRCAEDGIGSSERKTRQESVRLEFELLRELRAASDREDGVGVWLGQVRGEPVAVKRATAAAGVARLASELKRCQNLLPQHEHLLPFLSGQLVPGESCALVFEYAREGDLCEYLRRRGDQLRSADRRRMEMEVALGVAALHASGLVHCRLRASAVLLMHDLTCKVGSFGGLRLCAGDGASVTVEGKVDDGVIRWLAPEVIRERRLSHASDCWALGVVCWEIETDGAIPYASQQSAGAVSLAVAGDATVRLQLPPTSPLPLTTLVSRLFATEHGARPSAAGVAAELDAMMRI